MLVEPETTQPSAKPLPKRRRSLLKVKIELIAAIVVALLALLTWLFGDNVIGGNPATPSALTVQSLPVPASPSEVQSQEHDLAPPSLNSSPVSARPNETGAYTSEAPGPPTNAIDAETAKQAEARRLEAAALAQSDYVRHRDKARNLTAGGELAGAEQAANEAADVLERQSSVMEREAVLDAQDELEGVRSEIAKARIAEHAREAERLRVDREKFLDDLIARSKGNLTELEPFQNLSSIPVGSSLSTTVLREHLEARCKSTVIDTSKSTTLELVARNADVKVVSAKLLTASVRTRAPANAEDTPLTVVEVTVLVTVRSASSLKVLWSSEKPNNQTYLSSKVKDQTQASLIEQGIKAAIDDIANEAVFQSAFQE
ncbi:MAG TPA: hypothetical protein VHN77_14675 [Phycisphaerales bacterium]|nr:hypothetical protein [Phycisphaerales bacterium]